MGFFGPSRKEIWQRLSSEMDARYVKSGWAKGDKVEIEHGPWTLTLDTYAVSTGHSTMIFTRMRAPFVNPTGFRFAVYRKSLFTGLGKFLGMQDIEVGHSPFDDDFVVRANDEGRIRALLASDKIRSLIEHQKSIRFEVKDDEGYFGSRFPEGVDELLFAVAGVIKDTERLKHLYELFGETLDELARMGVAIERPPDVKLK